MRQGLSYPLAGNGQGGLSVSSGLNRATEDIHSLLETVPGERVMRPEYGSPLDVFEAFSDAAGLTGLLQLTLERWLPETPCELTTELGPAEGVASIEIRHASTNVSTVLRFDL